MFKSLVETTSFSLSTLYPVRSILKYLTAKELINRLDPVGYMEFFVDVIYMFANRFRAYEQFGRNFFIHQAP